MSAEAIRAPRLTEKVLLEDLPELVTVAEGEIDYLADALGREDGGRVTSPGLRARLDTRLQRLRRAHEWLQRKIAAETAHRGTGADAQAVME